MTCSVLAASPKGLYLAVPDPGADHDGSTPGRVGSDGFVLPVLASDAWALPTAARLAFASPGARGSGAGARRTARIDERVQIGATVPLDIDGLQLPGRTVAFVRVWHPARVPWRSAQAAHAGEFMAHPAQGVDALRTDRQRGERVGGILCGPDLSGSLTAAVRAAVGGEDPTPAVLDLLGRGPGLTPSGDDLLAGALLVLHAHGLTTALTRAVLTHLHRTTALSASLLEAAAQGYAVPEVVAHVRFACAPGSGSGAAHDGDHSPTGAERVVSTRHTVEQIGHWSGRDLLEGIDAALAVLATVSPSVTPRHRSAS